MMIDELFVYRNFMSFAKDHEKRIQQYFMVQQVKDQKMSFSLLD